MEQSTYATERAAPQAGRIRAGWAGADRHVPEDGPLVVALRSGDPRAFDELHRSLAPLMLAIALRYTGSRSVAEEIVQDTWLGVVKGIGRFEGRSTLKTWILRILHYRARTTSTREARSVALSTVVGASEEPQLPTVGHDGEGALAMQSGLPTPEDQVLASELGMHLARALATLPAMQRTVVVLRDITGWTAEEVCVHLGVSQANQRVLLHRGRKQVRQALGSYAQC